MHKQRRDSLTRAVEEQIAQGRAPLWISRSSLGSGKKLQDAGSVLCGTEICGLQKLQRLK